MRYSAEYRFCKVVVVMRCLPVAFKLMDGGEQSFSQPKSISYAFHTSVAVNSASVL